MSKQEIELRKYIPYSVDFDYLEEKVKFGVSRQSEDEKSIKFWDILNFFDENKIVEDVHAGFSKDVRVECEDGEYIIHCENLIARQVLAVLLNLLRKRKVLSCNWYLSDSDSCNEQPQFIHSFFLTHDFEIILEQTTISTSWMDDCDPNILIKSEPVTCQNSSLPLWSNMEANQDAYTKWYYQKFYKDTKLGQVFSLRDAPTIKAKNSVSSIQNFLLCDSSLLSEQQCLYKIQKYLKWITIICALILIKVFS